MRLFVFSATLLALALGSSAGRVLSSYGAFNAEQAARYGGVPQQQATHYGRAPQQQATTYRNAPRVVPYNTTPQVVTSGNGPRVVHFGSSPRVMNDASSPGIVKMIGDKVGNGYYAYDSQQPRQASFDEYATMMMYRLAPQQRQMQPTSAEKANAGQPASDANHVDNQIVEGPESTNSAEGSNATAIPDESNNSTRTETASEKEPTSPFEMLSTALDSEAEVGLDAETDVMMNADGLLDSLMAMGDVEVDMGETPDSVSRARGIENGMSRGPSSVSQVLNGYGPASPVSGSPNAGEETMPTADAGAAVAYKDMSLAVEAAMEHHRTNGRASAETEVGSFGIDPNI